MINWLNNIGEWCAEKISVFVGTWTFIILYTSLMCMWIALHEFGILHIDTLDFIKWNLFLSYYAGIQASILLMANERSAIRDRRRAEKTLNNTQNQTKQLKDITSQLYQLEGVIEDLYDEVQAKKGSENEKK